MKRFKDGREIYKSPRHRITTDDNFATLSISNVEQADAGNYTCEAYNQHGRVESTGTLIVNGMIANIEVIAVVLHMGLIIHNCGGPGLKLKERRPA